MKAFGKMPEKIDVEMKEIPGKGVEAVHEGRTILAGTSSLLEGMGIFTRAVGDSGTVVHLALDGKYQGYLVVSDVVKDDSSLAVKKLKKLGVRTVSMLTGDRYGVASSVSSSLGLDSFKAELLPHQKVDQVRSLKEKAGGGVIFAGDGINDAPSLATADVGIAMGGLGSEAAIETADLVILSDRPSEVADAISLARQTRRIVWQNIILALGVKAAVLLLGVAGISGLWEAVFADVGVALLAVLNSARTVRMSVVTRP
jgi:Cd2+/Zn2+-exporting ATPase